MPLTDPKHGPNYVGTPIPCVEQFLYTHARLPRLPRCTSIQCRPNGGWVRGVAHLVDVHSTHAPEARMGTLEVIQRVSHVSLGREHHRLQSVLRVWHALRIANVQHPFQDLSVGQASEAEDGGARLDRFDDLRGDVARKSETGGVGVNLHGAAQGLLSGAGHAVSLVEDYELVPTRGHRRPVLRKHFYSGPNDVYSAGIGGVELQHATFVSFRPKEATR
mmetsp:Transcript_14721/g.29434  ORF Transcript_14721/g.29434 Transcript_14721/m.29434 type:complete len:219 (+) Transcript_14721:514-1170(+)